MINLQRRLDALKAAFGEDFDGYIITNKVNMLYFAGFLGAAMMLIPAEKETVLYVKSTNYGAAKDKVRNCRVEQVKVGENLPGKVVKQVIDNKLKKLAFDMMSFTTHQKLSKSMNVKAKLEPKSRYIWQLRTVKDADELRRIREAANLTVKGMETAFENIRAGLPEYEVAAEIEYAMRTSGSYGTAFDTIGGGTALISSDTDGTCSWNDGGIANGIAVFAATQHGLGRVVYITDINFASGIDDPDVDGIPDFYEADNNLFMVNSFEWLSANRAPVITVTSPNGGETLTGASNLITWTAIDPNKDAMTYDIHYSLNGGSSWSPLAIGHTSTSINWDVTSVAESADVLIRVQAHDYELSGLDASDAVCSVESEGPAIASIQTDPTTPSNHHHE